MEFPNHLTKPSKAIVSLRGRVRWLWVSKRNRLRRLLVVEIKSSRSKKGFEGIYIFALHNTQVIQNTGGR